MPGSPQAVKNLARSVDLRIEALSAPTGPGQPQVFEIRPASLLLSAAGDLIPTEAVLSAAIPVWFTVKWGVEDEAGNAVTEQEAVVYSRPGDLTPGEGGVERNLQATVMVLPDFVELRSGLEAPVKTRYVTATISFMLDEGKTTEVTLPRHPITIPAVPVPTVAVFFAKKNLGLDADGGLQGGPQFALIVVPRDSPVASITALRDACDRVRRVAATASQLVDLAGFAAGGALPPVNTLATGLDTLLRAINAHGVIGGRVGVAFVARDSIRNLNNLDVVNTSWHKNDIEAEDTISSLVLLAPPGRRLRIFQDQNFTGRNASITSSDGCITIVTGLDTNPPTTVPPEHATQGGDPALDDRMSSLVFM